MLGETSPLSKEYYHLAASFQIVACRHPDISPFAKGYLNHAIARHVLGLTDIERTLKTQILTRIHLGGMLPPEKYFVTYALASPNQTICDPLMIACVNKARYDSRDLLLAYDLAPTPIIDTPSAWGIYCDAVLRLMPLIPEPLYTHTSSDAGI